MTNTPDMAKAELAATERAQALASDPRVSAWVSANAGAGKTHVLKQRVLRILLAGTPPDRILCLTYTKAAAAEMASRVFNDLSQWATATTENLHAALGKVLARKPTGDELHAARTLFARAIETPGGLKVQTIHAFCERLLQRFPLEAGVPPGFTILDEDAAAKVVRETIDGMLAEATRDPECTLGQALRQVVVFAAGDAFDLWLRSALPQRTWLDTIARLVTNDDAGHDAARLVYCRALGVRENVNRGQIEAEMAGVMTPAVLQRAAVALSGGGNGDCKLAALLRTAASTKSIGAQLQALQQALMTEKAEARADRFVSKATQDAHPEIFDRLRTARDLFCELYTERQALTAAEASLSLMRLADAVLQRYHEAKALKAALDFDDLVTRTANLLADAEAAAWVLLKLDGGLDHVLVDEAQDTSRVQWQIIEQLAGEFFPVSGGLAKPRTIFAVGDEKQSIYSFQGAEPSMFDKIGKHFGRAAEAARLELRRVPLTLSFRSVEPLLTAVDSVLADQARTPGLTAEEQPIRHVALRLGQAGCVELWDTEKPFQAGEVDAWLPLDEAPQPSPVARLADRIADTIRDWIDQGEMLISQGRPVCAGDILILLRRRQPFAGPMLAALKARGIAVAGADRLRLAEQIAVQDLLVLGDFLTVPEDDLALATVLKSPLFGLDDDDLLTLAAERKGSTLWRRLLDVAKEAPRYQPAAETLKRWRGLADQSPPFEFYAHVLDREGGRKRLIERLGPEAVETVVEFLNLAVKFDETEPPSLTGFLKWLRTGSREVKRDMEHGQNEVRVLTVHGAKGLEAPIVFLPDTCAALGGSQQGKLLVLAGGGLAPGTAPPIAWPVKGSSRVSAIRRAREAAQAAEQQEGNRLLYVAMTRARDRLYVTGWEGIRGRSKGCWYDLVAEGLGGLLEDAQDAAGRRVRRLTSAQTEPPERARDLAAPLVSATEPPEWARRPAPREPQLAVPMAPSRLAPYDVDEAGDPAPRAAGRDAAPPAPSAPSPLRLASDNRFQRGLITHALLEHLPTLDPGRWEAAARGFVATRGATLHPRVQDGIVAEVLALLRHPAFAPAFGPDSRAEVPLVAEIPLPSGRGRPLRLNAVIDRLVVRDHEILIIDYKTNRPPPTDAKNVAAAYLVQLAAYRLALRRVHPGRSVRAAILWTDGAHLMEIPSTLLDRYERELWQLAEVRLDV